MRLLLPVSIIVLTLLKDSWQATKIKIDPGVKPTFISTSQVFKVQSDETVVLPCRVANPGPFVLVWKRGIAVLSAGETLVSPDPRVTLNPDYSLEIKEVLPQDAGDYVCQIGTLEPIEITHTLVILLPPRIDYIKPAEHLDVKIGSSVRFECKSSGNPPPKITWSRINNILPSGEQTVTTQELTLDKVDRRQAGTYQCLASNGVGEDARKNITLKVLYPPEIVLETPVVYSGLNKEAQLVCIVHGVNQPTVTWHKHNLRLNPTEHHIIVPRVTRYTLIIRNVTENDFGNYTCQAENDQGRSKKVIQLTGVPPPVKVVSPRTGKCKDNYNISWEVESFTPITEYNLTYRLLGDVNEDSTSKYATKRGGKRFDKRKLAMPIIGSLQSVGLQSMSYNIRGLEPNQQYEAHVTVKNKYGWSPESEAFTFKTSDSDESTADNPHLFADNAIGDVQSVRSFTANKAQLIGSTAVTFIYTILIILLFFN
ncbi:hypothetical protein ABEB36_006377 [Hypothenemus hampei]|uniref:Uncharacterized protein n=1 Tax=Hypothenemus hampei TaxID=57062 RepID=A0ABD1ESK1_HYPHA